MSADERRRNGLPEFPPTDAALDAKRVRVTWLYRVEVVCGTAMALAGFDGGSRGDPTMWVVFGCGLALVAISAAMLVINHRRWSRGRQ